MGRRRLEQGVIIITRQPPFESAFVRVSGSYKAAVRRRLTLGLVTSDTLSLSLRSRKSLLFSLFSLFVTTCLETSQSRLVSLSIIHLMPGLEVLGSQGKHGQTGVSRQATVPRQRQGSGLLKLSMLSIARLRC